GHERGRADQGAHGQVLGRAAHDRAGVRPLLALRRRRLGVRVRHLHPVAPHPMNGTITLKGRGLRAAFTLGGSTAAWMAHLFFASSFVQYTCDTPGTRWGQHVATLVCAAIAASAGWVGYRFYREGQPDTEDAGTRRG